MSRYFILLPFLFLTAFVATAQRDFEVGFGVLGSGTAVDPLPAAYRSEFSGPITYLGYYVEGATVLIQHEKWKPRAIVRLQSEGSNASTDWPEIRILNTGFGAIVGYQLTPVVTVLAGGVASYQISSRIQQPANDQPLMELNGPWSGRFNAGIRGNFGRWCSEMLIEKSFTSLTGAVLLSREGSPSFQPSYSYLNVRLGLKYKLYQAPTKS
ncbi:MAG: hypothetical protein AB8F78_08515 [Saprospiraceae bacterium]